MKSPQRKRKEEKMRMIEPCCFHKQLEGLIDDCTRTKGYGHFFSYSDWTAGDLIWLLAKYCNGGEMNVAMVRADYALVHFIRKALASKYKDGYAVGKMILVTQPPSQGQAFDQRAEIRAQLGEFIDAGRLTVCEDNIGFRCITLRSREHALVIQGSLNTITNSAMQMFTLTASEEECDNVNGMFAVKSRTKKYAV